VTPERISRYVLHGSLSFLSRSAPRHGCLIGSFPQLNVNSGIIEPA
jgi:hypothetical protein